MEALPLESEFRAFANGPGTTVEGALLISRIVRPQTDADWCRAELRRLANASDPTPQALVASLRDAGFAGSGDYYAVENSALEFVLRERRGIPITLAMVLIGTAACRDIPATGINFPGHFLVEIGGALVDPFAMMPLSAGTRDEWLARAGLTAEQALRPAGPVDVVLRMLNNLKGLAVSEGDHLRALECTGYQLLVSPDPFALRVERAELWRSLGAVDMAREEIERAIALAPTAEVKGRLVRHLKDLGGGRPTLH